MPSHPIFIASHEDYDRIVPGGLLVPEQEAGLLPESLIPSKKAGEGLRLVQQILLVGFLYGLFKNMLAKRDESLDLES